MLGKTTISAIRALTYLAQQGDGAILSPRKIAEVLEESPTYLAKVLRNLVKTGILRAERGVKGGVRMGRDANQITLLDIVEACQGIIVAHFCAGETPTASQCSFHKAAMELHSAVTEVLRRWTLEELLLRPWSVGSPESQSACLMNRGLPVCAVPAGGFAQIKRAR